MGMKKIIIFLLLFLGFGKLFAQSYTNDATLVENKNAIAIVRSSGIHEKKKDAIQVAIRSAFDTYFFNGINGLNDNKPLLSADTKEKYSAFIERFFDSKNMTYLTYVANYREEKDPEKLPNKQFRSTVILEINSNSLSKYLENNKIPLNTTLSDPIKIDKEQVAQPTIMVVPYKQRDRSYKEILRETQYVDYRTAIARVQDAFIQKGYQIKDVMAVLEATEKSILFESNSSIESFDNSLINNSGADIYVTVDAGFNTNNEGAIGSIALVGYERASGKLLASKHSTTNRYKKSVYADLFRIAINNIIDDFLKDMTNNYARKAEMGNTFVLRITTGNNSSTNLSTEIPSQGFPLSDVMRLWLRKNALNGRFHVQGATSDMIVFDEIQVASKAKEGYFIDANDFALDVFNYLRNELGIKCDKRVDGNTIYITLDE